MYYFCPIGQSTILNISIGDCHPIGTSNWTSPESSMIGSSFSTWHLLRIAASIPARHRPLNTLKNTACIKRMTLQQCSISASDTCIILSAWHLGMDGCSFTKGVMGCTLSSVFSLHLHTSRDRNIWPWRWWGKSVGILFYSILLLLSGLLRRYTHYFPIAEWHYRK